MILLKSLQLINFLSHLDTKINFNPTQKLLVDGKSGAGKSSIIEAVSWCLYGQGRSDNRSLIRQKSIEGRVKLTLTDTDTNIDYTIVRSINKSGKHKLEIWENITEKLPVQISGMKALQEFIEQKLLHSSYLLFINSVCYPQDNIENFVKQSASKRKDIILEIARAGDYEEYYQKTKNCAAQKGLEIESLMKEKTTKEFLLSQAKLISQDLPVYESKVEKLKQTLSLLKASLATLRTQINDQFALKTKIELLEDKQQSQQFESLSLTNEISRCTQELQKLDDVDIITLQLKVSELNDKKEEYNELIARQSAAYEWESKLNKLRENAPSKEILVEWQNNYLELEQKIELLEKSPVEVCQPETGRPCPLIKSKIDEQVRELRTKLTSIDYKIKKHLQDTEINNELVKQLGPKPSVDSQRLTELKPDIASLSAYETQLKNASKQQEKIKELNDKVKSATEQKDKLIVEQQETQKLLKEYKESFILSKLQEEEKDLADQESSAISANEAAVVALNNAQKAVEDEKILTKEIEEINDKTKLTSYDIECLSLLKDAFGQNGIRAIVIDYLIPNLEDRINAVLSQLSDFRVKLDTQKSGVTGETTIEGLFISIFNEQGEEFSLDNYSGGEKLKIIVSIAEGLAEVQKMGFRILDETFIGLDEESTEGFVKVLNSLQERFNQLLCISHLRGIKDLFNDKITVTKQNGISTLS